MIFAFGIVKDINIFEIVRHPWFISSFLAGGLAQLIKFAISLKRTRKINFSYFMTSGGMPSAHSALVSALASAVGFTEGFDAPYAMIAVGLGLIVLCDAATLRREAGKHAELLNSIVEKLNCHFDESDRIEVRRLKERLGHKRREVAAGVVFGMLVAYGVCAVWDFWK
ncbi:MAG: divergent PAP2 family protein [Kiritimatiellae bacterium]|nr:divergent PAP2 family protein [Kiritimatiellia bacterium]